MRKYILILMAFLIVSVFAAFGFQNGQDSYKFDERAIVVLGYMDWKQDLPSKFAWPKVAFAIGDGTLLLTAAHCVDDFNVAPDEFESIDTVVVSPYYGDIFDVKILAFDKKADIAILKAPWSGHPALKIANEEEFEAAKDILIASRPQTNDDKSFQVGRNIKSEQLSILNKNSKDPSMALWLKGTKQVIKGWSGSPMLIPGSGNVAGVLAKRIEGMRDKRLFGLITTTRADAAGCNLGTIKDLIKSADLESAAYTKPGEFEDVPGSEDNFNLAMDFFEKVFTKNVKEQYQVASDFLERKPGSIQAYLLHAFSATIMGLDSENDKSNYNSLAETSYKKALELDPNNAHTHAAYGGFLKVSNRNKEALEQFDISLTIDSKNRMALFNKLMILDPNERKEFAESYLSIEPNNPRILFYYSGALKDLGEHEKALEFAQKTVKIDPNGLYDGILADALVNMERLDEAETNYKLMTEKCGCQSCWFRYANFLYKYRKDKIEEAKNALEKSESLSGSRRVSTQNRNLLKLMIYEKTDPNKAEALAIELVKILPEDGQYWFLYAGILRTLEKYPQAAEAAQKAVGLRDDYAYHPRLANCLAKAGDFEKAQKVYDELLKATPQRNRYWYYYAEFLVDNFDDRIDEAREALEKASTNPDKVWFTPEDDLKELQGKIDEKTKQLLTTPN